MGKVDRMAAAMPSIIVLECYRMIEDEDATKGRQGKYASATHNGLIESYIVQDGMREDVEIVLKRKTRALRDHVFAPTHEDDGAGGIMAPEAHLWTEDSVHPGLLATQVGTQLPDAQEDEEVTLAAHTHLGLKLATTVAKVACATFSDEATKNRARRGMAIHWSGPRRRCMR